LVMVAWGVKNHDGGHYSFPLSHVKSQQTNAITKPQVYTKQNDIK
jgi:hypothetical protein